MNDGESFGRWLKQHRKALDLTQEDLARQVGCSAWTIIKIEADLRRPSRQLVERVVDCLGTPNAERAAIIGWARRVVSREVVSLPGGGMDVRVAEPAAGWHADAYSPFIVGPPIRQPRHFFGRTFELNRVFALWRHQPLQNVAVIGAKRSGKTSFLCQLMTIAGARPEQLRPSQRADWLPRPERYRWVFVDFQDPRMCRRERLLRHLLTSLHLPAPDSCDLEQFMDLVGQHLRQPTLILLDGLGAALRAPELDTSFWEGLRSLASHHADGNLGFVLAAHESPTALALAQRQSSPFFNIFGHTFTLGPLTDGEARELIASSPQCFDPADVEWILSQSGRWPILLQLLCHVRLTTLRDRGHLSAWQAQGMHQIAALRHLLEAR